MNINKLNIEKLSAGKLWYYLKDKELSTLQLCQIKDNEHTVSVKKVEDNKYKVTLENTEEFYVYEVN